MLYLIALVLNCFSHIKKYIRQQKKRIFVVWRNAQPPHFAARIVIAAGSFPWINGVWLRSTDNQWQNNNVTTSERNGKLEEAAHMQARDAEMNIYNTGLVDTRTACVQSYIQTPEKSASVCYWRMFLMLWQSVMLLVH